MNDKVRETQRVDELKRGTWFHADFEDFYDAACVLHVETYQSDAWDGGALLLYRAVGDPSVHTHRFAAASIVRLLTEAEIADAIDQERREAIAARLAQIADIVRRKDTPLPKSKAVDVTFDFGKDADKLAEFAKVLGIEVVENSFDFSKNVNVVALKSDHGDARGVVDLFGLGTRRKEEPKPVDGGQLADETTAENNGGFLEYFEDGRSIAECSEEELGHR